jgi:cyclophilin family peptidyl-prolyl cis-trans isomerase
MNSCIVLKTYGPALLRSGWQNKSNGRTFIFIVFQYLISDRRDFVFGTVALKVQTIKNVKTNKDPTGM